MINRNLEIAVTEQQDEMVRKRASRFCDRAEEWQVDLHSSQAQVVLGVRRSGKSTLCFQVLHKSGEKFAYVNFDDERFSDCQTNQLNDILEVLYKIYGDFKYIFLDEIQNVEGWHLFVNRLLRIGLHVVVTLLSSELSTHLSGRTNEIVLFPLSFFEFCEMKGIDREKLTTRDIAARRAAFDEYMQQGGFPELLTIRNSRNYVKTLVQNIMQRDIEQRFRVAFKSSFENMTNQILDMVPTILNISKLANAHNIRSLHTIKNYVNYLKQAYLIVGVKPYSQKSSHRHGREKLYPIDVALMDKRDNAFSGVNLGHRLEVIVMLHLLRRCNREGLDLYYLNDRSGECDFVLCRGNHVVQAIQVSFDISNSKTRKREINGLLLAARRTGCTDLLHLTDMERSEVAAKGQKIVIRPVYEWSLEEEYR